MPTFYRKFIKPDIKVSALGLGCWAIGGQWSEPGGETRKMGQVDDTESIKAIRAAVDGGINFFDTADLYGAGHSERILGEAVKDIRDKIVISTKFGHSIIDEEKRIVEFNDGKFMSVLSEDFVRKACEASLKRMQTDYIDIYNLHIWSVPAEAIPLILDILEKLVEEGLIRTYAWSTDLADDARLFAEGKNCSALQLEMNVLKENRAMLDLCREKNLTDVIRSPLAMGLLSGKYTETKTLPDGDIRGPNTPDWITYFRNGKPSEEGLKKLQAVREILTSGSRTLVQGALAWCWGRSDTAVPIPGFRSVKQAAENAGAMEFGPLTKEQMNEIEQLIRPE